MKVLFIVPPNYIGRREISRGWILPNIGIASMAAFLRAKNISVRVIDLQVEHLSLEELGKRIAVSRPDIVGITAFTHQVISAGSVAEMIKRVNPRIYTILGGVHATALPRETLQEFEYFDIVVYGEGEITMSELTKELAMGSDLSKVKGIAYRDGKVIKVTEPRPDINNLDQLPFPAWDLFYLDKYRALYSYVKGRIRSLPVQTSRGCPYRCIFCSSGRCKPRMRSIESVINEIERDIAVFKVKQIIFMDETFALNYERTVLLCNKIIQKGINKRVTWTCETRVDLVDRKLLKKMKDANCRHIDYGVEAGNQRVLNIIKKDITLEQARSAIRWTKEIGIKTGANFIFGHPFETVETATETIRFARELNPDYAIFSVLVPYPGTEVMKMARAGIGGLQIENTRDWRRYDKHIGSILSLTQLDKATLERLRRRAYLKFYLRPNRFLNALQIIDIRALPVLLLQMGYLR